MKIFSLLSFSLFLFSFAYSEFPFLPERKKGVSSVCSCPLGGEVRKQSGWFGGGLKMGEKRSFSQKKGKNKGESKQQERGENKVDQNQRRSRKATSDRQQRRQPWPAGQSGSGAAIATSSSASSWTAAVLSGGHRARIWPESVRRKDPKKRNLHY